MNPCDVIQPELKAYLDGQLPTMLRQRVRRHLSACAACREELSAMQQISNQLHTDTPKPLESSLRARILNAVAHNASEAAAPSIAPSSPEKPFWRQRKPLLLWGGVATAMVAWFTLYPLLHGDLLRSVTAHRQSADIAGGASKSVSAAPAASAPAVSASSNGAVAGESGRAGSAPPATAHRIDRVVAAGKPESDQYVLAQATPQVPVSAPMAKTALSEQRSTRQAEGRFLDGNAKGNLMANAPVASTRAPAPEMKVYYLNQMEAGKKKAAASGFGGGRARAAVQDADDEGQAERQVHRGATLSVQVDNVEAKSEAVTQDVQTVGGFVASNELNTGEDNLKTASLSLKVPVGQFERVLSQVTKLGDVKSKNVTGEDLTEQISDQQQSEHVLRQDIDTTQEELTRRLSKTGRQERMDTLRELRTRVAQTQARLKLLRKLGALSTITLELTEKPHTAPVAPKTGGFVSDLNDTLHAAVQSMFQAARLPLLTFIWILAYSPLWILLILGYRYAVRR